MYYQICNLATICQIFVYRNKMLDWLKNSEQVTDWASNLIWVVSLMPELCGITCLLWMLFLKLQQICLSLPWYYTPVCSLILISFLKVHLPSRQTVTFFFIGVNLMEQINFHCLPLFHLLLWRLDHLAHVYSVPSLLNFYSQQHKSYMGFRMV